MENRNIGHNNAQKHSQNPKYSRLAAKIIQNNVKRKILEIKRRGEPAADELLDMLAQKIAEGLKSRSANKSSEHIYENYNASSDDITSIDNKSIVNSEKRSHQADLKTDFLENDKQKPVYNEIAATIAEGIALADKLKGASDKESTVGELFLKMLNVDKSMWRRFLCEVARNYSADALSCFGTNLVYGGFMTETAGNCPRVSIVEIESPISTRVVNKLSETLKKDSTLGRRICLISGNSLFVAEMLRIYRYFSETAFILVDKSSKTVPIDLAGQGIGNVMFTGATSNEKNGLSALGGLIAVGEPEVRQTEKPGHTTREGNNGPFLTYGGAYPFSGQTSRLFYFLSSPTLPFRLSYDELFGLICELEKKLSDGKNSSPNRIII